MPVLWLSGCGYAPKLTLLASGPSTEFSAAQLDLAARNQNEVLYHLSVMAGLKGEEPTNPTQWAQFGAAAIGRAQIECNAYLSEIMKVDESKRTINQGLTDAGVATAGILGVTGAAGAAIAITAIAFGLAQGTVDNVTTGLLYSIGPDAVRPLVQKLRAAYLDKVTADSWKDRPTTFNTIYGYLEICTPAALREKIKSAVTTAQAEATNVDGRGFPPQVSLTTQRVIVQQTVATPNTQLPPAPPQPVRAPGSGTTELRAYTEYVRQLQVALCVKPVDGSLGALPQSATPSLTRTAMRQYLSGLKGGATSEPPNIQNDTIDEIGTGNLKNFDIAISRAYVGPTLKTCAERDGFLSNAYEVGRWAKLSPAERAREFGDLLKKMRRELGGTAGEPLPTDANMEAVTRKTIGDLRKKWGQVPDMAGAENGFDYSLTLRIAALPGD